MHFNYIQILFFCIIPLSCGGGKKNIHNQRNSEDSAAIAQEILESKKKLEDRALNEKATIDSFYNATFKHVKEYLKGGWYCVLNKEISRETKSFDLFLFDFSTDAKIAVNKIQISDNAILDKYIKHEKTYVLPFKINDEITPSNTDIDNHKTTYLLRQGLAGEKFVLTLLGGMCQSLSFYSENNEEITLSKLPKVVLKNGETIDVFPTDISMSEIDEAKRSCSNMPGGWRLPTAEEFEGVYKQIYQNKSYGFKKFLYWTSSELKKNWYDVAFDTRSGKNTGYNNTAYVRPVRKNNNIVTD
jgi:hypothetical protein